MQGVNRVIVTKATPIKGAPAAATGDIAAASEHYNRALEALKAGNWPQFGTEMQRLGAELKHPRNPAQH